jgi:signal peptidase II
MKVGIRILILAACAFSLIGCDRVTKDLAKEHLMNRESISYFHDTFRLVYVENTGAFFGLGNELPTTIGFLGLSIIPLMVMVTLLLYIIQKSSELSFVTLLALTLIVSGGLGNVIDRILYDRHVTDFMNLGIGSFRTGIFNVADVCITVGSIAALIFFSLDKQAAEISSN